jgi:ABC-2 type transport system ATP-binding protein
MAVVLATHALTKRFQQTAALDGLSITMEEGHIYGLVGLNGAGKTTLLRILAGLSEPTSGSFSLLGGERERELRNARKRIGFLVGEPIAVESFSIRRNLELYARLTDCRDPAKEKELRQRLGLTARGVGLRPYKSCSVWEKQRYGIAAALLGDPALLVLDEPLNGLDPAGAGEALALLEERKEKGVCMLIASTQPEELPGLVTDYFFLREGRLAAQMQARELKRLLEKGGPEALETALCPRTGEAERRKA